MKCGGVVVHCNVGKGTFEHGAGGCPCPATTTSHSHEKPQASQPPLRSVMEEDEDADGDEDRDENDFLNQKSHKFWNRVAMYFQPIGPEHLEKCQAESEPVPVWSPSPQPAPCDLGDACMELDPGVLREAVISERQEVCVGVGACACARVPLCVCVCPPGDEWFLRVSNFRMDLAVQGKQGPAGLGRIWAGQEHRHWLYPGFLLAGVDTTSGLPRPSAPVDCVLVVLQKGA